MNDEFDLPETTPVLPPKRRRFTRVDVELIVQYFYVSSSGKRMSDQLQGTSRDISGGGFLLEGSIPELEWIPKLLLEEIKMEVHIDFPVDGLDLTTEAKVAWIDPHDPVEETFQLGVEFEDLSDEGRKQIVDFVIRETTREN